MRKSAGFTLIELVIVIIILGILGAVAAPRLFNLQGDAYGANLNALKSSISTAATMANAKAQIQGEMGKDVKNIKGYTAAEMGADKGITFNYGYPIAGTSSDNWEDGILGTLENFESTRYDIVVSKADGVSSTIGDVNQVTISPESINNEDCRVTYTEAYQPSDGETEPKAKGSIVPARVSADTSGC